MLGSWDANSLRAAASSLVQGRILIMGRYVLQTRQRPKAHYMQKQKEITAEMRAVLNDWMVEVCEEYKYVHDAPNGPSIVYNRRLKFCPRLRAETLFLAVNYVDRFLSYMHVTRGKLQLVGVTAMFIAGTSKTVTPLVVW